MKLECLQENLAEGLTVVGRVVPAKSTLPILSNVLLSTRDGELQLTANNLADVAYQSNMSRIKYADTNNVTGRIGVYNMGRNISFKLLIPIDFK